VSFFQTLLSSSPVAHDLLLLSAVILSGIGLGHIRIAGVRLGVAGVLFTGLLASHLGLLPGAEVAHFLKDFGLVLFVFALGMQMGPGFFASLRRDGLKLNLYAAALVLGGGAVAVTGGWFFHMPMPAVAGLFAGATTNTPALGAAQQALQSGGADAATVTLPALAYAATYPLAVVGIILALVLLRVVFHIHVSGEAETFKREQGAGVEPLERMNLRVENPNLEGVTLAKVPGIRETRVIISRFRPAGESEVHPASPSTVLHVGDVILAVGTKAHLEQFRVVIGSTSEENLMKAPGNVTYRRVVLTSKLMLGKTVRELGLDHLHNVTVTRVSRGDQIFSALPDLRLQFGDMLQLVGDEESLNGATAALGNAVQQIQETKFAAIFAGILLGIALGLYPFQINGLPAPVKLGLAGGPLVVAILLSHLGRIGPLIMHMPINANRALRELGIILFLACVGLLSGEKFAATVFTAQGLQWVALGFVVTLLPLLLVGTIARRWHGMNYMTICGLLSGGMTDPPALAFATGMARCDSPAVAYAAVYPLTMLLRIIVAQVLAQWS
jgi:putative transport protein